MIATRTIEETLRVLIESSASDVVGLWTLVWDIRKDASTASVEEVRAATLDVVGRALDSKGIGAELLAFQMGERWVGGALENPSQITQLLGRGPVIALIKGQHFVVVDGMAANGNFMIRDPWGGGSTYQVTQVQFFQAWTGHGVFLR